MRGEKLIFLDRNIVSLVKDANARKSQADINKVRMLKKLKNIDRKNNVISPMFSIIEGQHGFPESYTEMQNTINRETEELSRFFRKATTDGEFIKSAIEYHSHIFVDNERSYDKYDAFLRGCNPLLVDKVKASEKEKVKNKIKEIGRKLEVPYGHPVFMCCISVLYGSDISRKIIKFKKNDFKTHNARSDLLIVTRLNWVRVAIGREFTLLRYITMDANLDEFISLIGIIGLEGSADSITASVTYDRKLFPDLNENKYLAMGRELGDGSDN